MNSFGARLSSFGGSRNIPPAVRAAAAASGTSPYEIVSLDFANQQYWRQGVRSSLAAVPGFTASGGVNGTRQTAAGIEGASAPRINTAGSRGLVVEGARTNLFTSDGITGASWVPFEQGNGTVPTVTANAGEAPDGSSTAARVQFSRTLELNADRSALRHSVTVDAASPGAVAVWVKSWDGSDQPLSIVNSAVNFGENGFVVGDQWRRVELTYGSAVANAQQIYVGLWGVAVSGLSSDVLLWRPTLEEASTVSSTIPGGATRTADSIALDMSDLGLASDQEWAVTYADGSTGTLNAVADTLTFLASTKVYASAYAVAP